MQQGAGVKLAEGHVCESERDSRENVHTPSRLRSTADLHAHITESPNYADQKPIGPHVAHRSSLFLTHFFLPAFSYLQNHVLSFIAKIMTGICRTLFKILLYYCFPATNQDTTVALYAFYLILSRHSFPFVKIKFY